MRMAAFFVVWVTYRCPKILMLKSEKRSMGKEVAQAVN